MKQLILAEKPSVARDLSQILGATEKHIILKERA